MWLEHATGRKIPIHKAGTRHHVAAIADIIALRRTWYQPRPKRQPITHDMLKKMRETVARSDPNGLDAVVFDWLRLGVFTGSRAAEYMQGTARRGEFDRIPDNNDTGEWAGSPLAFIAEDFVLWDEYDFEVSHEEARACPHRVAFLHMRFRYDKSPKIFLTASTSGSRPAISCVRSGRP